MLKLLTDLQGVRKIKFAALDGARYPAYVEKAYGTRQLPTVLIVDMEREEYFDTLADGKTISPFKETEILMAVQQWRANALRAHRLSNFARYHLRKLWSRLSKLPVSLSPRDAANFLQGNAATSTLWLCVILAVGGIVYGGRRLYMSQSGTQATSKIE